MPEEITREIFDHLVDLAALEMDEEEADYLRKELNNQLNAIHELEAIEFDPSTPVTSQPCLASVIALVPVPQPRSNARPGVALARNTSTSGGVTRVSHGVRPRQ